MVTIVKTAAFDTYTIPPNPNNDYWNAGSGTTSVAQNFITQGWLLHLDSNHEGNTGSFALYDPNRPPIVSDPFPGIFTDLYPMFSGKQYILRTNWKDASSDTKPWTESPLDHLSVIATAAAGQYLYYTFLGTDPNAPSGVETNHTLHGELDQLEFGYGLTGNVFTGFTLGTPLLTISGLSSATGYNNGTTPFGSTARIIGRQGDSLINFPQSVLWGLIKGDTTALNVLLTALAGVPVTNSLELRQPSHLDLLALTMVDGELCIGGRSLEAMRRMTTPIG